MILVVSNKVDTHVDRVADVLNDRGVPWIRVNSEDLATNAAITIDPVAFTGGFELHDSGRRVELAEVGAVWFRRPEPVQLPVEIDEEHLGYLDAEFDEFLNGCYALLESCFWLTNPSRTRLARRKLLQLRVASSVGFSVPRTIVTNSPEVARRFGESVRWDLAVKSLASAHVTTQNGDQRLEYGVFCRRVGRDEFLRVLENVRNAPTLLQGYVQKTAEFRVTCVGEKVFACRIDSQNHASTADDYRFGTGDLPHNACQLPPSLVTKIHAYMKAFSLEFGCFDFVLNPSGEYVFLECNVNGQWLWVERLTGLPIGAAIADRLIQGARSQHR